MRSLAAASFAAVFIALAVPERAWSCSSGAHDSLLSAAEAADAVFLGEAVRVSRRLDELRLELQGWAQARIEYVDLAMLRSGILLTEFAVERVFKGDIAETAQIYANPFVPSCGYAFEAGTRYVVFARLVGKGGDAPFDPSIAVHPWGGLALPRGRYTTGLSSGNLEGEEAIRQASVLGPGQPPVAASLATETSGRVATAAAAQGWTDQAIGTAVARGRRDAMWERAERDAATVTARAASRETATAVFRGYHGTFTAVAPLRAATPGLVHATDALASPTAHAPTQPALTTILAAALVVGLAAGGILRSRWRRVTQR